VAGEELEWQLPYSRLYMSPRPMVRLLGFPREVEGSKEGIAEGLEGMAWLTSLVAQPERAARLFGSAEALRQAINLSLPAFVVARNARIVDAVRAQMDEGTFAKAWAEGRAMPLQQAIDYALDSLSP